MQANLVHTSITTLTMFKGQRAVQSKSNNGKTVPISRTLQGIRLELDKNLFHPELDEQFEINVNECKYDISNAIF